MNARQASVESKQSVEPDLNGPGQDEKIQRLKDLLFREEIDRVQSLNQQLNDSKRLEQLMRPILEQRVEELQKQFPAQFGPVRTMRRSLG